MGIDRASGYHPELTAECPPAHSAYTPPIEGPTNQCHRPNAAQVADPASEATAALTRQGGPPRVARPRLATRHLSIPTLVLLCFARGRSALGFGEVIERGSQAHPVSRPNPPHRDHADSRIDTAFERMLTRISSQYPSSGRMSSPTTISALRTA
jgi:hypothetical protein